MQCHVCSPPQQMGYGGDCGTRADMCRYVTHTHTHTHMESSGEVMHAHARWVIDYPCTVARA